MPGRRRIMTEMTPELRQHARQILIDLGRSVDKRLAIEVRDVPGTDRLKVKLSHGSLRSEIELTLPLILGTEEDSVAKHELKLRLKRAHDQMLFRPMPNHRKTVRGAKPVPPPLGRMGGGGPGSGRR
jgi:hypothetical protein